MLVTTFQISCPKCRTGNQLKMIDLTEGNRILCRHCDMRIVLTFTGKTPQQIIEDFRKELQDALPKELKLILR